MRKYFNTPTIKVYDPMITWYRIGQSTFSSCDHICGQWNQKWTKAQQDDRTIGSASKRTKPVKMRKYFNTPTIKVYDNMITWYKCGQPTFSSCDDVGGQRKVKMDKKHHRTKEPKAQNQSGQNPQKWENILIHQQSRCTIKWSHNRGVDNQHSRHAITWAEREKQKRTKAS